MHRRRFLAGAAGGAVACLLSGCGEGVDARRIAVNGSIERNSATNTSQAVTSQGLALLGHEFYRRESSAGVRGTVENHDNVDLDFIAAHTRFFDQTGTRIGRASDYESGFPAGERWKFDTRLLDIDPASVARYQLVVIDQRSSEVENPFEGAF